MLPARAIAALGPMYMTKLSIAIFLSALFMGEVLSSEIRPELNEAQILAAERAALTCERKAMGELFQLSADFWNLPAFNATLAEELAGANESVIFKCPEEFLSTLEIASKELKEAVTYHIGLFEIEKLSCLLQARSSGKHKTLIEKYMKDIVDFNPSCTENGA